MTFVTNKTVDSTIANTFEMFIKRKKIFYQTLNCINANYEIISISGNFIRGTFNDSNARTYDLTKLVKQLRI